MPTKGYKPEQIVTLLRQIEVNALNYIRDVWLSSIAVGITVAPIPVISVHSGAGSVELTIGPMLCHQVAPVSAIFAVIPVMVTSKRY